MVMGRLGDWVRGHKNFVSGVGLVLAVALLFGFVYSPRVVGAAATERELPVYCVQRDGKYVSLTFDAAWGNEDTQILIDTLAKYNVKATFFVVGEWVDKYPESVKALADAGHEVMNHSDAHPHMSRLSAGRSWRRWRRPTTRSRRLPGCGPPCSAVPTGSTTTM